MNVLMNVSKVPDNINQWTFANSKESGEKRNFTRKIQGVSKKTEFSENQLWQI